MGARCSDSTVALGLAGHEAMLLCGLERFFVGMLRRAASSLLSLHGPCARSWAAAAQLSSVPSEHDQQPSARSESIGSQRTGSVLAEGAGQAVAVVGRKEPKPGGNPSGRAQHYACMPTCMSLLATGSLHTNAGVPDLLPLLCQTRPASFAGNASFCFGGQHHASMCSSSASTSSSSSAQQQGGQEDEGPKHPPLTRDVHYEGPLSSTHRQLKVLAPDFDTPLGTPAFFIFFSPPGPPRCTASTCAHSPTRSSPASRLPSPPCTFRCS